MLNSGLIYLGDYNKAVQFIHVGFYILCLENVIVLHSQYIKLM